MFHTEIVMPFYHFSFLLLVLSFQSIGDKYYRQLMQIIGTKNGYAIAQYELKATIAQTAHAHCAAVRLAQKVSSSIHDYCVMYCNAVQ
jgi:hypothetical protein